MASPQYVLNPSSFDPTMVGTMYNLGLGNGTVTYGYNFRNQGGQSTNAGLLENTDVATKQALVNYGSSNLVDRDLVFYPRVSQGDWSGGAGQVQPINANQYWDGTLDPRVPGLLQQFGAWKRKTITGLTSPAFVNQPGAGTYGLAQVVTYQDDLICTFAETNGNVYAVGYTSPNTAPVASSVEAGHQCLGLITDGDSLYAGMDNNLYWTSTAPASWATASWSPITGGLNGTANNWWYIENDVTSNTSVTGRKALYVVHGAPNDALYSVDINAARPVAPGSQPQVPTGNASIRIVDIVPYQNGIAILTNDPYSANKWTLWYHDGTNMTMIIQVYGYVAAGMCSCLGNIYVSAWDIQSGGLPVLTKVASGEATIAARPGVPGAVFSISQGAGDPTSSNEYVFWLCQPLGNPFDTSTGGYGQSTLARVFVYDTLTDAGWFLPNTGPDDFGTGTGAQVMPLGLRPLTGLGANAAACWTEFFEGLPSPNGIVQYQMSGISDHSDFALTSPSYIISSNQDFATPGVAKRFRTVSVHHTGLPAGCSMTVSAYVDMNVLQWTVVNGPTSTATVTNSVTGSTETMLTMPTSIVGFSMYYVLEIQNTTGLPPQVEWVAIEAGGTWTWILNLDCTSQRRLLNGNDPDQQGVTGKDLYYLIRNAYENGEFLTLYLEDAQTYTVSVESMTSQAVGYVTDVAQNVSGNSEWYCQATLRQAQA